MPHPMQEEQFCDLDARKKHRGLTYPCLHGVGRLQGFAFIDITYATEKIHGDIPNVFNAMRFHAGNKDGRTCGADLRVHHLTGFRIMCGAFDRSVKDEHGLDIKVVVNWDLSPHLDDKPPQAILGNAVPIIAEFG